VKAYVTTTGVIFGLVTLAHIMRMITERPHLAEEFWYVSLTLLSAALCFWAFWLIRRSRRS
jgi:hypothetical protein